MKRRVLLVTPWYPFGESVIGPFIEDQSVALAASHAVAVVAPRVRRLRALIRPPEAIPEMTVQRGIPVLRPRVDIPVPRSVVVEELAYVRGVERALRELRNSWGVPDL